MPDTEIGLPTPKEVRFYNLPEEPPLYYINGWQIKVTGSEVTLILGNTVEDTAEEQIVRKSASIVLTHEFFTKLAASIQMSLDIVKIMHNGELPEIVRPTLEQAEEIGKKVPGATMTGM